MANEHTVVCTYRVRPDADAVFASLLHRHWQTLRELEFVTNEPALVLRSIADPPTFVEVFTWVDGGFELAHEHPDVLALWEPMGELVEPRGGLPGWEFPHYRPLAPPR